MLEKQRLRDEMIAFVEDFPVRVGQGNEILAAINNEYGYAGTQSELTPLKEGCRLKALVLRPQLNIMMLARYIPELAAQIEALAEDRREEIVEAAEVLLKYDGYIKREQLIADKIQRLENVSVRPLLLRHHEYRAFRRPTSTYSCSFRGDELFHVEHYEL